MKYTLMILILFLISLLFKKENHSTDYSEFDSLIDESRRLQDSAECALSELMSVNDSMLDIHFPKQ